MHVCRARSRSVLGVPFAARYFGAPTTTKRNGPQTAHADHVRREKLLEAHADVIAVHDEIDDAVVDRDIDLRRGVVREVPLDDRRKEGARDHRSGDP